MNTEFFTPVVPEVNWHSTTVTVRTAKVGGYRYPSWGEFFFNEIDEEVPQEQPVSEDIPQNYLYVNLELQNLTRSKKEVYGSKRNFTYDYYYFCSTIAYLLNVDKRHKGKDYVCINYKTMTEIVSKKNYSAMVKNLIRWNVIEENPSTKYQVGKHSKSYKLLPPYNSNLQRIPVEDRLINNKINQFKMSTQKEIEKLSDPYQYLSMTNTWIAMDVASAISYSEINYQVQHEKKHNANLYAIYAYEDNDYRFTVDSAGNRAHTNLTNLSSELRQFLYVEGEQLAQVDISNSQPLFFYLHIKNLPFIPSSEKEQYRELVENGDFYEYFMRKLGIPFENRKKVKQKVLTAVFFDRYRRNESRYLKVFKEDFPRITAYITELRKKDHTSLARLLQKTESKFVIEKVVGKFIEYYGEENEFIATIHDSIVVKASFLNEAKKLVEKCFNSEGIRPKLKTEKFYSPPTTHYSTTTVPIFP